MSEEAAVTTFTFILAGEAAAPDNVANFRSSADGFGPMSRTVVAPATTPLQSNEINALVASASSDFVSIIDKPGKLNAAIFEHFERFIAAHAESAVVYGDETQKGESSDHELVAKPIFSPERLRCQYYWGNPVFYRSSFFSEIGGLDSALPGAELYDLALRAARSGAEVGHIHEILFEGSGPALLGPESSDGLESTRSALQSHLDATGGGEVRSVNSSGIHDTRRVVKGEPLVSIVIPTRGIYQVVDNATKCFVVDAVASILEKSTYTNIEIVLVIDAVADPKAITELNALAGERITYVQWDRPFNFSEKVNHGVLAASGEFVLILNDDVEVITPDWIQSMLALAQLPGAGMVGGMLYYEDDTIQHAGHAYWEGDASHIGLDTPRGDAGPLGGYLVEREVVGVTAACALMPKSVFVEVGGFSHLLPGNFNDVDLCMKTTWRGFTIYWTPHAELYHFESKTRDATVRGFEVDITWSRWGFRMHDARYWPYPLSRPPR